MKILRIKETCLYVADLDRSINFYSGKLGLENFSHSPGRHAFFHAGESVLLCFVSIATAADKQLPPHYGFGKLHLAFEVSRADYAAWKDKVTAAGIPITHEEKWPTGLWSFYFEDPDGHVLEIIEEGLWNRG